MRNGPTADVTRAAHADAAALGRTGDADLLRAAKEWLRADVRGARPAQAAPTGPGAGAAAPAGTRRSTQDVAITALSVADVRAAATVAAFVALPGEPSTDLLLDRLHAAGVRVLLPVVRPDRDLDWARYGGREAMRAGPLGTAVPAGPVLGPDAIATADVVLVPAVAVDAAGRRLGRGGGSYDRALRRLPAGRPVVALVLDEAVVDEVPAGPHDIPVTCVVTPTRVLPVATPGP